MAQSNIFNFVKLDKFINTNSVEELTYYNIMAEMNSSAKKTTEEDIYLHIYQKLIQILSSDEIKYNKNVTKYIFALTSYFEIKRKKEELPSLDLMVKCKTISSLYKKYVASCTDKDIKKNSVLISFINNYINSIIEPNGKTFEELGDDIEEILKKIKSREKEEDFSNSEYLELLEVHDNKFQRLFFDKYSALKNQDEEKSTKIKELESNVEKLTKQVEKLLKSSEETKKKSSTSKSEVTSLLNESKGLQKEIKNLNKKILQLEEEKQQEIDKNSELTKENENNSQRITSLLTNISSLEKQIEDLNELLNSLNLQVSEYEKIDKQRIDDIFLDELVTRLLVENSYSIDNLLNKLQLEVNSGYSREDVIKSLKRIREKGITIENTKIITIPKMYTISEPKVPTNLELNIDVQPDSCLDLFILSDFHLTGVDEDIKYRMDGVFNYCENNGIKTILNLGDLLDGQYDSRLTYEDLADSRSLVSDIIENFPTDPNVMHVVLGGNHDRNHLRFGTDPIKEISDNREDIASIGYEHASINFPSEDTDFFMIHHGYLPREEFFGDDKKALGDEAKKIMQKEYIKNNKTYNESYVDLYGHQHRSRFDLQRKQVLVPSITRDRYGAYHLKVYFDKNKKIKYMMFIPLNISRAKVGYNLYPQTEILYEKPSR